MQIHASVHAPANENRGLPLCQQERVSLGENREHGRLEPETAIGLRWYMQPLYECRPFPSCPVRRETDPVCSIPEPWLRRPAKLRFDGESSPRAHVPHTLRWFTRQWPFRLNGGLQAPHSVQLHMRPFQNSSCTTTVRLDCATALQHLRLQGIMLHSQTKSLRMV